MPYQYELKANVIANQNVDIVFLIISITMVKRNAIYIYSAFRNYKLFQILLKSNCTFKLSFQNTYALYESLLDDAALNLLSRRMKIKHMTGSVKNSEIQFPRISIFRIDYRASRKKKIEKCELKPDRFSECLFLDFSAIVLNLKIHS